MEEVYMKNVKETFNGQYFKKYTRRKPAITRKYLNLLKKASRILKTNLLLGNKKLALDIGCATGYGLRILKTLGYDAHGIDVSTGPLSERVSHSIVLANVEDKLPFSEKFSLITCLEVLEHLPDPKVCIKQIHDFLTDEGVAIITTDNPLFIRHYFGCNGIRHCSIHPISFWKNIISRFEWDNMYISHATDAYSLPIFWRIFPSVLFTSPLYGAWTLIIVKRDE